MSCIQYFYQMKCLSVRILLVFSLVAPYIKMAGSEASKQLASLGVEPSTLWLVYLEELQLGF